MLGFRGQRHPWMLARLPDGEGRRWKRGIGERTHGDRHDVRCRTRDVEDGRAALGTEVVRPRLPRVGDSNVFSRAAGGVNVVTREPRLEPERTPGPALASEAVADRDSHRLSFDLQTQLAAPASGAPRDHGEQPTQRRRRSSTSPDDVPPLGPQHHRLALQAGVRTAPAPVTQAASPPEARHPRCRAPGRHPAAARLSAGMRAARSCEAPRSSLDGTGLGLRTPASTPSGNRLSPGRTSAARRAHTRQRRRS